MVFFCCTRRYAYQPPPSRCDQHRSPELIRSPVAPRSLHTSTGVPFPYHIHSGQSVLPQSSNHQSMPLPTMQGTRRAVPVFLQGTYNRYILLLLTSRSKFETCNAPSPDSDSPATSDPRYRLILGFPSREIRAFASSCQSLVPLQCYRTTSSRDPCGIDTDDADPLPSRNT